MTRDEIINAINKLDEAVSIIIDELDEALFLDDEGALNETEHIAAENIVFEAAVLNDYIINFFVEVNSE